METRHLEYILTIVKCNFNLTRAATELLISQPALSKLISIIEMELDTKIFVRKKGRLVQLTPSGEILVKYSHIIRSNYNKMLDEITYHSKNISGKVRLGITTSLHHIILKTSLTKFILSHPQIVIELIEGDTTHIEKLFGIGELDIIITLEQEALVHTEHRSTLLASEAYVAIMDMSNPLTSYNQLTWKQLEGVPLALPARSLTHVLITKQFRKEGISPRIIIDSTSSDVLIHSTKDTEIVSILPKIFFNSMVEKNEPVTWRPFATPIYWNVLMKVGSSNYDSKDYISLFYNCMKDSVLTR